MAGESRFFFYIYALTIVFLACICEASVNQIRSAFSFLSTFLSHPIATARFIKLLDENNPATRYKIEKRDQEPTECVVCLSRLEKGNKIRKLKCNHMFHKVCVDTWLQQDLAVACPICRATVLPEEIMLKLRQRENADHGGSDDQEIIFLSLLQGIDGETGEELTQQGDHHQSEDFPTQEEEL